MEIVWYSDIVCHWDISGAFFSEILMFLSLKDLRGTAESLSQEDLKPPIAIKSSEKDAIEKHPVLYLSHLADLVIELFDLIRLFH